MYTNIHCFNNSFVEGEKQVNPVNMAITPKMVDQLTSEGRTTSMHQLDGSLYFDDIPENSEMPLDFVRGVDENDAWEASEEASEKMRKFKRAKQQESSMTEEH